MDSPDLSPGRSPWDTNRTNRTRSSGGKYESAHFLTPADFLTINLIKSLIMNHFEISTWILGTIETRA